MVRKKVGGSRLKSGERVAVLTLLLFPLLVAAGFMTPGWVRLIAIAEVAEMAMRDPVRDRVGPYGHRPLSTRRGLFASSSADPAGFSEMFSPFDYQSGMVVEQMARVSVLDRGSGVSILDRGLGVSILDLGAEGSVFDDGYGDWIFADPVGQAPMQVVFRDVVKAQTKASSAWAQGTRMDPLFLCGTLHAANCVTDDDMTSPTFVREVVPEPNTALLMGLGLLGLGVARRRSV